MSRRLMALAAVLALVLALVPAVPQAAPVAETGELTVTESSATSGATYRAWKVLACNVSDGADGKVARDVSWASDAVEAAVDGSIRAADASYQGKTAQDAAEWMVAHLADGPTATALASALAAVSPDTEGIEPGTAVSLEDGYWLVATEPASVGEGMAGTAPIFVLVGGSPVSAEPKAAAPTLVKEIQEVSDASWGPCADATVGDSQPWRLRIEVPAGLTAYASYPLEVVDEMDSAIDAASAERTLKVYVNAGLPAPWEDAAKGEGGWSELVGASHAREGQKLTVTLPDLVQALGREDFDSGVRVLVRYDAPLTNSIKCGASGAVANGASLVYPSSPIDTGKASTPRSVARDLSWDPVVLKRSSTDDSPLAGAVLRVTDDRGRCWNGSRWTENDSTVTTGKDGKVRVRGCDSGRYSVEEVSAPKGYRKVSGSHSFEVSATLPKGAWSASSVKAGVEAESPLETVSADAASGEFVVALPDDPESAPLRTGDILRWGLPLLAAAIVLILAFVARRRRKQDGGGAA